MDESFRHGGSIYFEDLTQFLEGLGYVDEKDLFGAPYDFRYGPIHNPFFTLLKELIIHAYETNDQQPVILITHSLGSAWINYFLQ